jgi:mono/diheme cytochrome c family protein
MSVAAGRRAVCARIVTSVLAGLALAGCEPIFRDMYDQPKQKTASSTPLFADGLATRPPAPDSVPRALGEVAANTSGTHGQDVQARLDAADTRQSLPVAIDTAWLARGQERFTIYCAPCHGNGGIGDGAVVRRGFPAPPSYLEPRLKAASDRHFFDVMTNGYGVMYSYGGRVDASDRWAIVAWIRRLQTTGDAPLGVAEATHPDARRR